MASAVKYGYMKESSIAGKIASGALDAYDCVWTSDTHKQFIVKPDLTLMELKGSINSYNSEYAAVDAINADSGTYPGQMISIKSGDKYVAYIVNGTEGSYTVSKVHEESEIASATDIDSIF